MTARDDLAAALRVSDDLTEDDAGRHLREAVDRYLAATAPNPEKITLVHTRHFTVRRHQTWEVDVDPAFITAPHLFDAFIQPTSAFDQYACDVGRLVHTEDDVVDDDDLSYSTERK